MAPSTCVGPRARPGPARLGGTVAALTASFVLTACATAGEGGHADAVEAPPFSGVRQVALVRRDEPATRASPRRKDPLDALGESLGERGIATRVIQAGPGREHARRLETLWSGIEERIRATPPGVNRRLAVGAPDEDAARVVREIGADALALYLRLDRGPSLATGATPPSAYPPSVYPVPGDVGDPAATYRPVAALALVARDGRLAWVDWGPRDDRVDPPGPVNAAEALDEVIRLLTGEPPLEGP